MKRIVFEKLEPKSDKYKYMRYPNETIGYYLYYLIM